MSTRVAGYHKVYVDPAVSYRLVVQFRPAPPTSTHRREIYLVAAGAREDYAVYRTAHLRTAPDRSALDNEPAVAARVEAARSRSPHVADQTLPAPAAPATAPATSVEARRVPQR